jgi:hypothetical protein
MGGDEPIAGVVINEAREQGFTLCAGPGSIFVMVGRKLGLDGVPCRGINQRRMLARIPNAPVVNLPYIKRVRQDFVEVTARKGQTTDRSTAGRCIWLGREIEANEFGLDPLQVFEFQEQVEDRPDGHGLGFIDGEGAVLSVIADGYPASHPHSLLLGCCDLVADPLPRDFALELRKGQKDRRPIDVVVLNCWVTETNETPAASKISTIFAKSANDRVSRSTL